MAAFDERSSDTTHANHPTLATSVRFSGRFENPIDPVYGFTTDFDYFQIDLTGVKAGTRITLKFDPNDAYFYRVTARLDEDANLHSTSYFPGSNFTWFNHQPPPLESINGSGTYTWRVPDLSGYSHPAMEFEIRGGGPPNGPYYYTPLDYALNVDATVVNYTDTAGHNDALDLHRTSLRLKLIAALRDDFIWAGQADDTAYGGDGRDVGIGDRGDDTLHGDNGDPSKGSPDQLLGGYGRDKMWGNGGNDYMNGEWDPDEMHGENGNDVMYGGFGADSLYGDRHDDTLYGGSPTKLDGGYFGKPIVVNWDGVKNKAMSPQAWTIAGENQSSDASDDRLDGGKGNDKLYGQSGNDILKGGDGNDRLTGGSGRDFQTGGRGADIFDFDSTRDSRGSSRDKITDFEQHQDKIDLSSIDADTTRPGNQVFIFLGLKPYRGQPGDVRWDGTVVHADVNGDSEDDLTVTMVLKGTGALDGGDFIL